MTNKNKQDVTGTPYFGKADLLRSEKYAGRRDLIDALLDGNEIYTAEKADEIIENYLKGKVN